MNELKDNVREGIHQVGDRAKGVADQAIGAATAVKDQAVSASHAVADIAGQASENVQKWAGEAYDNASQTMKTFGTEATDMVKKYPIQSVLVGFGVGLLIGRAARS
jgi:ElaB/YqjD/DUF883 family membrane-anchored ribosome-binding protein